MMQMSNPMMAHQMPPQVQQPMIPADMARGSSSTEKDNDSDTRVVKPKRKKKRKVGISLTKCFIKSYRNIKTSHNIFKLVFSRSLRKHGLNTPLPMVELTTLTQRLRHHFGPNRTS